MSNTRKVCKVFLVVLRWMSILKELSQYFIHTAHLNQIMRQQSSQHKQVLKAAITTAFIMILSECCFQQFFHMSWPFFLNLLHLIKTDPIFYNQSQNPLQDVSIPLAIATCRLGSNGNGAAVCLQRPPLLLQPPQWPPEAATTSLPTCFRPLNQACLPTCPCRRQSSHTSLLKLSALSQGWLI
ncbi:hypothetical protein VP01_2718g4 [Puccinia sorghi]|uniref:Uncharacterized protein n=1 Tax=Puccinia sorghi TaxID=27349 RepID=A0A0L6V3H8_9BASI|nr:hypothetical protein VP01_2718g4 [Puccinia sorghi]